MHSIQNKSIAIDGCPINILSAGDFASTPLLFLHGKAFQAQTWQELGTLDAAIQAGFSVVALDLPGFGKSPAAELSAADVISGVMKALTIVRAIVIGPSMGGKIGIEFTLTNPEKVAGLVLIGAVGVQENLDRLNELPAKTLILWGEVDPISDPANGVLLNTAISGSELIVFKGAKHPCYLEHPKLWHQTLVNFAKTIAK